MQRRQFLHQSTLAMLALPLRLQGHPLSLHGPGSQMIQALSGLPGAIEDRIVVIINLAGGNDGLNTVIPIADYNGYLSLRSNIAVPIASMLALEGENAFGLHPALTGLQQLYNQGELCIVHSAGYPNPNQSHARSSDIWMTATAADQYASTGWAARYLENRFTGFPDGYPNPTMEDPLALQIGLTPTPTFYGTHQSVAVNLTNAETFYQLIGENAPPAEEPLPCCQAGEQIAYLRSQQLLAVGYSGQIKNAADKGKNLASYPPNNRLADQLKIVARLIHGGLKTKMYFVQLGGFDTHATQVSLTDNTTGAHANLLSQLGSALLSFQTDLKLQGTHQKVLSFTFSEFGRRANSNASLGTDHGYAAPMFVVGTSVQKQQLGTIPDLVTDIVWQSPGVPTSNRFIGMQMDFRRVYTDILTDWFGNEAGTTQTLLFGSFATTSLLRPTIETIATGQWGQRSTWSAGRPPLPQERVVVRPGHTLHIPQSVAMRSLDVQGNLQLAPGVHLSIAEP